MKAEVLQKLSLLDIGYLVQNLSHEVQKRIQIQVYTNDPNEGPLVAKLDFLKYFLLLF